MGENSESRQPGQIGWSEVSPNGMDGRTAADCNRLTREIVVRQSDNN